jgi:hypothetical protein
MQRPILAGAIDQTIDVFIMDSTSTTGAGKTGLAFNTASLVCYYRKGATGSATALTLATQTVGGAHSDGGFVEIDATNMPGWYRLDLSDTMVAATPFLSVQLKGATGMAPCNVGIPVVSYNPYDGVRLGLTALPNAAAEAAGGLYTRGTGAGQLSQTANGELGVVTLSNSVGALGAQAKSDVNAEVLDVLNVDTFAQPGQGTPAATNTIRLMVAYLFKAWRNKATQTATEYDLYNDDAATVDQKATFADDGTTATRGEIATGP